MESVKRMRSTMTELRPPMLDQYGLTATLYWYSEQYQRRTEIQVNINDRYMENTRLSSEIEIALFRIAQEALNNVAKHADATRIEIELFEESGNIMMAVTDNGVGFDTKRQISRNRQHWGVPLMQERARAINGEFLLRSVPEQGTQIVVKVKRDMTITVFLADDHRVLRDGLRILLESQDDIEVIGEAENGNKPSEGFSIRSQMWL